MSRTSEREKGTKIGDRLCGDLSESVHLFFLFLKPAFDSPVWDLSFGIGDLEVVSGGPEVMTARAFDPKNGLLEEITARAGEPGTGSQRALLAEFVYRDISRIDVTAASATGREGWGIDNLHFVPLPPAFVLLATAFALVGIMGTRKNHRIQTEKFALETGEVK